MQWVFGVVAVSLFLIVVLVVPTRAQDPTAQEGTVQAQQLDGSAIKKAPEPAPIDLFEDDIQTGVDEELNELEDGLEVGLGLE
jgi:hypothetical protein